jgi:predicted Zn-dependent protease
MFNDGFSRYQAGEPIADLIPVFQEIAQQEPEEQSVWVCLSWLYLLHSEPLEAARCARKAVFLDRDSAQAHINLALALTDSKQQGITYHLQQATQLLQTYPEQKEGVLENFGDAAKRRPDWTTAPTIQSKVLPPA